MSDIFFLRRMALGVRRRVLRLLVGDDAILFDTKRLLLSRNTKFRKYDMGSWSYGTPEVLRWSEDQELTIGKYCSVAEGVSILLGGEHRSDFVSTFAFGQFIDTQFGGDHEWSRGPVRIGNDVWIGRNATILSGVTIGDGAIIGAAALVARDVAPFEIVAGNPAKHVRYRFTAEQIDALMTIRWWEWSDETVKNCIADLMSPDIAAFIRKYGVSTSADS